jgi:hypothetical protein
MVSSFSEASLLLASQARNEIVDWPAVTGSGCDGQLDGAEMKKVGFGAAMFCDGNA